MEKEKIERINFLAKKSKTTGLTVNEKAEQQALRKAFLEEFRGNFKQSLQNVVVTEEDGTETPLTEFNKKDKD